MPKTFTEPASYTNAKARAAMLPQMDIGNRFLQDASNSVVVDWGAHTLNDNSQVKVYDWNLNMLYVDSGGSPVPSINVASRTLIGTDSGIAVDWAHYQALDTDQNIVVDWDQKTLSVLGVSVKTSINWGNRTLNNGNGTSVFNWATTGSISVLADLKFTDATYDIGKTGATRPRDFFLSRNTEIGGTANITGAITNGSLSASSAVVTDGSKVLVSSATTAAQIGYLSTTTSDVQTQIQFNKALIYCAQRGVIRA